MTTQKEQDEKTLLDKAWEIHGDECMFGGVFPAFRVGFLAGLKQGREENAMVRHAGFWDGVKMEKEEWQEKIAELRKKIEIIRGVETNRDAERVINHIFGTEKDEHGEN